MEQTLEFIEKQVEETYEGIETLMNLITSADCSYDDLLKHGKALSKAHGKIYAYLEVKKQLLKL